jgi:hypothetical protein
LSFVASREAFLFFSESVHGHRAAVGKHERADNRRFIFFRLFHLLFFFFFFFALIYSKQIERFSLFFRSSVQENGSASVREKRKATKKELLSQ